MDKQTIQRWFESLQDSICKQLEDADGNGKFVEDSWNRSGGGGGRSRVLVDGKVIEKGGVNFSAVWGELPDVMKKQMQVDDAEFFASGVSIVMHPSNPHVPIIHMNVRYFEMSTGKWWFGGGIDLTPHYIDQEQAGWFHRELKSMCDRHHVDFYPKFKNWADDYFFLSHRDETRGVGGIFFDYLNEDTLDKIQLWSFVQDVGALFAPVYTKLMQQNAEKSFNKQQKNWQMVRRGRYVEFNLVHDRGTRFGLETKGRTESILMSLPPLAGWHYNYQPDPGTKEHETQVLLKKGVNWAD